MRSEVDLSSLQCSPSQTVSAECWASRYKPGSTEHALWLLASLEPCQREEAATATHRSAPIPVTTNQCTTSLCQSGALLHSNTERDGVRGREENYK